MSQLQELTELFRKLGAPDPEEWASSEINEGINQLGRFLFLRQAWRIVIEENDTSWIQSEIDYSLRNPGAPCAGIGLALQNILSHGVNPQDITDVARGMQYALLFSLCYLLDDPGKLEDAVANVNWGLMPLAENGQPLAPIAGLHESVLETDPTAREMRHRQGRV